MSADFERLRAIVQADPDLQAELVRESDAVAFVARMTRLAAEHDLAIAQGTVWTAIEEGRQLWFSMWSP